MSVPTVTRRVSCWMGCRPEDLRSVIAASGLSYRRLAAAADVSPSFISHLVTGRESTLRPGTARRIAAALGVPTEDLFDFAAAGPGTEADPP